MAKARARRTKKYRSKKSRYGKRKSRKSYKSYRRSRRRAYKSRRGKSRRYRKKYKRSSRAGLSASFIKPTGKDAKKIYAINKKWWKESFRAKYFPLVSEPNNIVKNDQLYQDLASLVCRKTRSIAYNIIASIVKQVGGMKYFYLNAEEKKCVHGVYKCCLHLNAEYMTANVEHYSSASRKENQSKWKTRMREELSGAVIENMFRAIEQHIAESKTARMTGVKRSKPDETVNHMQGEAEEHGLNVGIGGGPANGLYRPNYNQVGPVVTSTW